MASYASSYSTSNVVTLYNLTTNTSSDYNNKYLLEYKKSSLKSMKLPSRDDDDTYIIQATKS